MGPQLLHCVSVNILSVPNLGSRITDDDDHHHHLLVFLLVTERNQLRSVYFDPLLLEARGVFFRKAFGENFSTFFSGRVRRLL